jgi:hypothetical protein
VYTKPHVVSDWRRILRRAWSIRFGILAALLAAAEVVVPLLATSFPPHVFAVAAAISAIAGVVSRIILQRKLRGDDQ